MEHELQHQQVHVPLTITRTHISHQHKYHFKNILHSRLLQEQVKGQAKVQVWGKYLHVVPTVQCMYSNWIPSPLPSSWLGKNTFAPPPPFNLGIHTG